MLLALRLFAGGDGQQLFEEDLGRLLHVRALRQNGVVLFIDRPVEALAVGGDRPLSSSAEALRTMEAQRRPLYLAAADAVISNTGTLAQTLAAAQEALDEIFDS